MDLKIPNEPATLFYEYSIPRVFYKNCIHCARDHNVKNIKYPLETYTNCAKCYQNIINFWLYSKYICSDKNRVELNNIILNTDKYAHEFKDSEKLTDISISIWKLDDQFISEVNINGEKKILKNL